MSGRNGLTWVTALTIASLLLGSGALNALADGRGGGNHGGSSGPGNAGHQQQTPAHVEAQHHDNNADNGKHNVNHDDDKHDVDHDVDRKNDDKDDLVTRPDRVTDDARPGLGCGDDNHEHMGPPGNPHKTCKDHDDNEDENDDD